MRRLKYTLAKFAEMAMVARTAAPLTPREVRAHLRRVDAQRARDEAVTALTCQLCAAPLTDSVPYWQHPGCAVARVCQRCAEVVANAFAMQHSGQWMTWPNPARHARKRSKSA